MRTIFLITFALATIVLLFHCFVMGIHLVVAYFTNGTLPLDITSTIGMVNAYILTTSFTVFVVSFIGMFFTSIG